MTLSLAPDVRDGYYRLRQETKTSGLISLFYKDHILEESYWMVQGQQLRPVHYRYQRRGGRRERNADIHFDWQQEQITNKVNNTSWRMPTEQNIMDKLLYKLAIMHDLNKGVVPKSYIVADGGRSKTYHFKHYGEEVLQTALGEYFTVKLERFKPTGKRRTFLWCAPALDHLPVKISHIEKDGIEIQAKLEALQHGSH